MKLSFNPADLVTLTAPVGGVVSGSFYQIGSMVVCAQNSAAATEDFVGVRTGEIVDAPADTADTWVEGEVLYWDDGNSQFTDVSATGLVQCAVAGYGGKAAAAAVGRVIMTGHYRVVP